MTYYTNKNVLVTGASGITGHATVKRLLSEGANVRAAVHTHRKLMIEHPKLEVVKCDLMNHEDCLSVLKDMDICFNYVAFIRGAKGQTDSKNALDLVRNNLFPSINMFDAAVRAKIDRFGFVGSSTMYPDVSHPVKEDEAYLSNPHPLYTGVGWMKRYSEKVVEYYNSISTTKFGIVRTTAIYGPHDAFNENGHVIPQLILKAHARMNPFEVWGDGTQTRDFIYVDDVVDALMTVVEKNPTARAYNAATGNGTTVKELVETITDLYGYSPLFKYDISKPTMIPTRLVDVSRIKNELGWQSKHSLREGLEKTISWFEKHSKDEAAC
jgi:nucleoside-diphosphate-sugar epimerase